MVFNQGYTDYPSVQCDKCRNKEICKYSEKYKSICDTVANIDIGINVDMPIYISITCKKFNKKTTTRDDLYNKWI